MQNIYTKNDNLLFVVAPNDGNVFTQETLSAIDEADARSVADPIRTRVDGVTNYQHTTARRRTDSR